MYRVIMAIGMVAATCLVLGCGSSGGDSTSPPLTKAQFIKQGNAICAKFTKEREATLRSVAKTLPDDSAGAELRFREVVEQKVAPLLQEEAKELKALAEPERDRAEVTRMLDNFSRAGEVASEGDLSKALRSGYAAFEREAHAYGLEGCPSS
jgi:hypothetical protein